MKNRILPLLVVLVSLAGCDRPSDQDYVERAKASLADGQEAAAIVELKNALGLNPDNPQARWLLGEIHLDNGRYADAAKELAAARKLGIADDSALPLLAGAWLGSGDFASLKPLQTAGLSPHPKAQVLAAQAAAHLADDEPEPAERLIRQSLALDPGSIEAKTELARLSSTRNEAAKAVELLQALGAEHAYAPAWALLGDLQKQQDRLTDAEAAYGRAIEVRKSNTAELLKRGLLRIRLQKYADAQADLQQVAQRFPKHFEANFGLGQIAFLQGRYDEALALLEASVSENGTFVPATFYLAATHLRLGNLAAAENAAARVVANAPGAIAGRKLLAQIRFSEGKYAETEVLLDPVVRASPDDAPAMEMLAAALVRQGKHEGALHLYERLVEMQPESAIARLRLGGVLLLRGADHEGLDALAHALKLDPTLAEAYQMQARHFLQKADYDRALAVAKAYREAGTDKASSYVIEGQVRQAQGRFDLARQAFAEARALAPEAILPSHALAALDVRDGDYAAARTTYESILERQPDHLDTLMKLATLDEMEGKRDLMVQHLQQAIAAHPTAVLPRVSLARHHLAEGRPDQVAVVLGGELNQRQDLPAVLEVQGMAYLARGDAQNAKATFTRLAELQPKSAEAHFQLAQALSRLNDGTGLQRALERVLQIDPDHVAARIGLARLMLLRRDMPQARQQLATLEEMAPGNPDVLALRGAIAQASGDTATAVDAYTRVFNDLSTSTTMLALARQKWSAGDQAGSLALMEDWVAKNPDDAAALLALASAYTKAGRQDSAVTSYQTALRRFGENPALLNNLAWQLKDSDPTQALHYAEKAAQLAPDSAAVADTYALVLSRNSEHAKAQRTIERALQQAPSLAVLRYHSALIDVAAGNSGAARQTLKALLADPSDFAERGAAEKLSNQLGSTD